MTVEPKPKIRVAAGIFYDESGEKFIMGRRLPDFDSKFTGFWEFPGGKIDGQETPEQALRREIEEELGGEVAHLEAFESFTWNYPKREVELHFFKGKLTELDLKKFSLTAHSEIRWFSPSEALAEKDFVLPANFSVLEKLR